MLITNNGKKKHNGCMRRQNSRNSRKIQVSQNELITKKRKETEVFLGDLCVKGERSTVGEFPQQNKKGGGGGGKGSVLPVTGSEKKLGRTGSAHKRKMHLVGRVGLSMLKV